ncbi:MAG: DMT family transporter [Rhodospirillaceae bacterium]|jgi:drug/metabolite transporter (DMT)-like permease|nr:DMT family transporter [Rhodospirillaceae bacterium]
MTDNLKGTLWMLAAVGALTVMAVTLKHVVTDMSPWQAAWLRMCIGLGFLAPWVLRTGARKAILSPRLPMLWARGLFGSASFALTVYALGHLILADAMVLSFTTPFWVIPLAALFLGEYAGWRRALATALGFIGVLLVLKPQFGIQDAMLIALLSALLRGFVVVFIKNLSSTEPPRRIVFWFFAVGVIVLAGPALLHWTTPTHAQWGWLALAALGGWLGQEWLSRAYREGEATIIAPLEFTRIPIAAIIGLTVFAEIPDSWTLAGTAVIIGAAYIISRTSAAKLHNPKAM